MTYISPIGLSYAGTDYSVRNNFVKKSQSPESAVTSSDSASYVDKSCLVNFYNSPVKLAKIQQEIDNAFIITKDNEEPNSLVAHKLKKDNIFEFSQQVNEILLKNNVNTPNSIVEVLKKSANTSDKEIEDTAKTYKLDCYQFNANKKMTIKREFLQTLIEDISKTPNPNGTLSDVEIKKVFSTTLDKINSKYDVEALKNQVKTKVEYAPDDFNDSNIELNEEEIELLKQTAKIKPEEQVSLKDLYDKVINLYVGGDYSLKYLPEKLQRAVLSSLPRYDSKNSDRNFDSYEDYENMPVSRWMFIKNPDEFVKQFEVDGEYSYGKLQSCSKNNSFCENQFGDTNPDMTVKFIIHPKSDVSKAYDLGERKYGNKEVVYPPNQKFKILAKNLVEMKDNVYDWRTKESYTSTFYRYEIHMQEE